MKTIELTQGKRALVDDEDYEYLNSFKWTFKAGYALRVAYPNGRYQRRQTIYMHREVMGLPVEFDGREVDHKDHDGLNNTRENLRVATRQQNTQNRTKQTNPSSSTYKGVSFHKATGKWDARITVNKTLIRLGLFADETQAAAAYDKAATSYFGEFAQTNGVLCEIN